MAFLTETFPRTTMQETLRGLLARMRSRAEQRRRVAEVRRELSALSDRDLNDIGISRFDIEDVARQSADQR